MCRTNVTGLRLLLVYHKSAWTSSTAAASSSSQVHTGIDVQFLDRACTAQPYQMPLPKVVRPESQGGHTDVRTKHKIEVARWQTTGLTVSANLHANHVPP